MTGKSRGPLEASVESYLVERVREAGGFIRKLEARVNAHWPDRLVLLPWIGPDLVELKRPRNGRLSDGQKELHTQLAAAGHKVWVLWTKADVDEYILERGMAGVLVRQVLHAR